jgi:glycosyltransferase involved in cell wall biosynthesis
VRGGAAPNGASTQAGQVLLLAPSRGLGGGIERYVEAVQSAFDQTGVPTRRLDLTGSGPARHRALLGEATAVMAGMITPARLVIAHRALLPVATVLARRRPVGGISVICHGSDVWGSRWRPRWQLESLLMRRDNVRLVAVSSFTAGALSACGKATILPPGLSRDWFCQLVSAADSAGGRIADGQPGGGRAALTYPADDIEIMTAFRLREWRDKGLPQLTAAIAGLGRGDVRLTVCGSGEPPAGLVAHVRRFPWCALRPNLSDVELAARFARADLFALATRTRSGSRPCGEGFGLVLLEAQVAGTAVVGPAHGGSTDAYLEGMTGVAPRDESVSALAQVLDELISTPGRLAEMGERSAAWARARFAPDKYAALAVDRLL